MKFATSIRSTGLVILAVMLAQFLLASIFVIDFVIDVAGLRQTPPSYTFQELMQIAAWFGLALGLVLNGVLLRWILHRSANMERSMNAARGAFGDLMESRFVEWGLSPSERDVAMLVLKGYANGEIAGLLGKAEGTVKAQSNAVYRKSSVTGRVQLLSLFIEDLLGEPLVQPADKDPEAGKAIQSSA